jgi:hypothetical protein
LSTNQFVAAAAALSACVLGVSDASAQTAVQTGETTFVIHAVEAPKGEQVALPGRPLIRQPVTSTRAARFDEDAPSTLGMGQVKVFPAGTMMFGVQVPDGWIYCAVSTKERRFWFADEFACYQDTDNDGRFDFVRPSGQPFNNVPLFVLQPGPPKPLPAPVRYSLIPHQEGPRVEIGITWKPDKPGIFSSAPKPPPDQLAVDVSIMTEKVTTSIQNPVKVSANGGRIDIGGADITLLGLQPDGSLRYRVDSAMPAQVSPMKMTLTTSTYYYVVTY